MESMTEVRERVAGGAIWVAGAVLGLLSTLALAIAAAVPAVLGLIALILSPFRALWRRAHQ
jgi:hypothetical protein